MIAARIGSPVIPWSPSDDPVRFRFTAREDAQQSPMGAVGWYLLWEAISAACSLLNGLSSIHATRVDSLT
jgi:hypothetical protein